MKTKYIMIMFFIVLSKFVHGNVDLAIIDIQPPSNPTSLTYKVMYWDTESIIPNPCYTANNCRYMGVGFQLDTAGAPGELNGSDRISGSVLRQLPTMGDVARYYRDQFGFGTVQKTAGLSIGTNQLCYAMKYSVGSQVWLVPGATCSHTTPPPVNACYIDGPITIDHGDASVGGDSRKDVLAYASCLLPANIRIKISGLEGQRLYLGGTDLYTELYLNAKPANEGININVTPPNMTEFRIESYIKNIPSESVGQRQGNAVIIHEIL